MQGNSPQGTREAPRPEREEEQGKNIIGKNTGLETEEGEVSSERDYEGARNIILTPKKYGRGRKSKKEERDQKTYRDVLSGSQPTIRQLISVILLSPNIGSLPLNWGILD
jgi:hypothetical protein